MHGAAATPYDTVVHTRPGANLKGMRGRGEFDEQSLVELARTDPSAFAELYRRHVQAVHAFALRRTGSPDDADDITAVTFEKALRSLHRYDHRRGAFVAWLYRIATNEIIDQARRRARQHAPRGQAALRLLQPDRPPAADQVDDPDPALRRALDRLPDRANTILSLRFVAGLEPAEIAAHLGISNNHCAVLTHRALAALRAALAEEADR